MWIQIKKRYIIPVIASGFLLVGVSFKEDFFEVAKQIEIFTTLYKTVNQNYVDQVSPADLMDKAIKNMLADLDPYTNYFNEQDVVKFKINNFIVDFSFHSQIFKIYNSHISTSLIFFLI